MKYINKNIIYVLYKVIIILEIKVALISYSLSKAASKATDNNGLITLIYPTELPSGSTVVGVGYAQTVDGYNRNQQISRIVGLTGCCPMK